jgi:hypothetical protein
LFTLRQHSIIERRSARSTWIDWRALHLQPSHRPKENDQDADSDERQRCAREKLRCSIETLAAP